MEEASQGDNGGIVAAAAGSRGEGTDVQCPGQSSEYSCHLFLISYASLKSIPFLSFIVPIFA